MRTAALRTRWKNASRPEPPVVRLHPNSAHDYREKMAILETALADPTIEDEAMESPAA